MDERQDTTRAIIAQRDKIKQKLDAQSRWALKPTAALLAILGLAVGVIWFLTNDESTMSMLLFLTAISLIAIGILLYFFSPGRFLRDEVYNAMCMTDSITISKVSVQSVPIRNNLCF